jgi:hypothetical protein
VFRRRRAAPDPIAATVVADAVPARYRPVVADALRGRDQFGALLQSVDPGPLHDRLTNLAGDIDDAVMAVWNVVQHAARIERVVEALDIDRVTDDLKQAKRAQLTGEGDAATVDAMAERFASTQRLLNSLDETRRRLPVIEARLGTAVGRAAELVLTSPLGPAPDLDRVHEDLVGVTEELDALRAAADELR